MTSTSTERVTENQQRRLRTLPEAAALLRTPEATLRYWRHLGTGPRSFKIGRHVMYDETDLYRWIDQQRDLDNEGD